MRSFGKSRGGFIGRNPFVNAKENFMFTENENCATYNGILIKSLYFIITVFIGVAIAFSLNKTLPLNSSAINMVLLISVIVFMISPFVAFFVKKTIPVSGALYCISFGMIYGYIASVSNYVCNVFSSAIFITLGLFLAMLGVFFIFGRRFTKTVSRIITIVFFTSIFISLFFVVSIFFPSLRKITYIFTMNPLLGMIFSIICVILACLYIYQDFSAVSYAVENNITADYEWTGAFTLVFSLMWLYIRVLSLLLKIMASKSRAK